MSQMLQCYKCGGQNMLGMRFCTICGERFVYKCPQCGVNIDPGSDYCSHCASKLDWGMGAAPPTDISLEKIKSTKPERESIKENGAEQKEQPRQRGMSPWLIAFIIIVILIVVIFVIDGVLKF